VATVSHYYPAADLHLGIMAIRDALSINLDESPVGPAAPGKKGRRTKGKGRLQAAPEHSQKSRAVNILSTLFVVFILVAGVGWAIYGSRKTPAEPQLQVTSDKETYSIGALVKLSVKLSNVNGVDRTYELPTAQEFEVQIFNESGGAVARYNPVVQQVATKLLIRGGDTQLLGVFYWNQTVEEYSGSNSSWAPVPSGSYLVKSWLNGHGDVSAQKTFVIA
jgi:hypothetical protein